MRHHPGVSLLRPPSITHGKASVSQSIRLQGVFRRGVPAGQRAGPGPGGGQELPRLAAGGPVDAG